MAERGGICPVCQRSVANGVGPSDMPLATEFLHTLPSSHLFYEPANLHDVLYHIGNTEKDRKKADKMFLEHMLDTVKKRCDDYEKPWFTLAAYRNYFTVRWFGERFFNYEGCGGSGVV
jgi:hypothetical protein